MNALIYDIEILKAPPDRNTPPVPGIEYCAGWQDHANMGVTVCGAYDYVEDRYRVFCQDNLADFFALTAARDLRVGFNNIAFDDSVLKLVGELGGQPYDLLRELWIAHGLPPEFNYKTHGGFGLDATVKVNFGLGKTGTGAHAPVEWQRGNIGNVIDYCLNDVFVTKRLFDEVIVGHKIKSPKDSREVVLRHPGPEFIPTFK